MNNKIVILFRGVPGSGKTTLATTILNSINCVSADDMWDYDYTKDPIGWTVDGAKKAHIKCKQKLEDLMKENRTPLGVHNTFVKKWEMEDYYKLAEVYNYKIFSIIVENRHGSKSVHDVPLEKIEQMKNNFEIIL